MFTRNVTRFGELISSSSSSSGAEESLPLASSLSAFRRDSFSLSLLTSLLSDSSSSGSSSSLSSSTPILSGSSSSSATSNRLHGAACNNLPSNLMCFPISGLLTIILSDFPDTHCFIFSVPILLRITVGPPESVR